MHLKLDEKQKRFVEEIAALSGIQKDVIREVWEQTVIHYAEEIATAPDAMHRLQIPFVGELVVKYLSDTLLPSGELSTEVEAFTALSDQFKKLIGDIHDEGNSMVLDLLKKKIENAILMSSTKED